VRAAAPPREAAEAVRAAVRDLDAARRAGA
jgi:hypothetical protein